MVIGGLLVAIGTAWIHPPSAVIVVGVELIVGAILVSASRAGRQ
jgi:hypothetical protein